MDSIIFEDPSKPRISSKQHARAVPASFVTSPGGECIQEVEPQAVIPVPEIGLHEHSHTSNGGHSEPSSRRDQSSETPHKLCCSPPYDDTTGDRRMLEETFLRDDFSLAQIDENGLAESLDDDLDSLFSGVSPDLEWFKTTGFDEDLDGQAQSYTSRVAETCDVVISLPSDDLVRSETPSLRTKSDAIDLTMESNCPRPKLTTAPSPQRYFPQSSRHKPRIDVVIPSRRRSPVSQPNLSPTQPADAVGTPNGSRRRTASPRPEGHIKRGRKRRHRSESAFDYSASRRARVEADSNETPSLFHPTLMEGTAAHSRRKETQLHKPGFKYGATIEARTHDSIHRSDSEQTLIDPRASINYEDETRPDILRGKLGTTPASSSHIDEPLNSHHEKDQHQHRLKALSVQPVTASDAASITAIIDRAADLQDFLQAPAAWALACGVQPDNLANIALKPLANCCWLLTATVSRCTSGTDHVRRRRTRGRERWSPDPDTSSDFCPSEGESDPRPTKRGQWTSEEDDILTKSRRLGEPWSRTFDQFPGRSETAVRSRWFVVLAPRMEVNNTRSA